MLVSMIPIRNVMVGKVLWFEILSLKPGTLGCTSFLLDKCTGFFYITQHTGPTKDEASW